MNTTNFIIDNTTMDTLSAFIPSGECWGEYSTIVLGILLFISEAMPFIKAKSKCNEVADASGADEEQRTIQAEQIERKDSIMTEANGLAHILMAIYEKSKKK